MVEGLWLALTGFGAGVCGGLLGIGGSIVTIPAMTEILGPRQHLYQAASLIVNFFVAAPAVWQHLRAKATVPALLKPLVPAAVVGAVAGVLCSELPVFRGSRSGNLTALFGLFLLCIAGGEIRLLLRRRLSRGAPNGDAYYGPTGFEVTARVRWRLAFLVGLPTGVISGLLGVGGGILLVPLLRYRIGVGIRSAVATSAATIVALSLVGATAKHVAIALNHPELGVFDSVSLAVFLIPTAIVGSLIGARLTHALPQRAVHGAFTVLLILASARMILRAFE